MGIKTMDKISTEEKSTLDMAIHDCMTIGPPENWNFPPDYKRNKRIVEKYGEETLSKLDEIEQFLNTIEPRRKLESSNSFCRRVSRIIKKQYPILENDSVSVLTASVAYCYWK